MPVEKERTHRFSRIKSPDSILGLSFVALSIVFLLYTIPLSTAAAAWPRAVLVLLLVLGAAIAVRGVRQAAPAPGDTAPPDEGADTGGAASERPPGEWSPAVLRRPALTTLIVVGYIALLDVIGFFPATALYLCGHLWFGGVRDLRVYAGVTVAMCGLVYLLFVEELSVPLPTGLLFG